MICLAVLCATNVGAAQRSERVVVPTRNLVGHESFVAQVSTPGTSATTLLVFLHGVGGSERSWQQLGGDSVLRALKRTYTGTVAVVAVRGDSLGWPEMRDGRTSWERVLLEDLDAFVRTRFGWPIDRRRVAFLGVSAGGDKVLAMALRNPNRFGCIATHSAALHPADPSQMPRWAAGWSGWEPLYGSPIDVGLWRAQNPIHLALTTPADSLRRLQIYFDVGADDHLGFNVSNGAFSAALASRRIPHRFAVRPGRHGDSFYRANLQHSLAFLLECLQQVE